MRGTFSTTNKYWILIFATIYSIYHITATESKSISIKATTTNYKSHPAWTLKSSTIDEICKQTLLPPCNSINATICDDFNLKNGGTSVTPSWTGCILKICHNIWRQQCLSNNMTDATSSSPLPLTSEQFITATDDANSTSSPPPELKEEIAEYSGPSVFLISALIIAGHVPIIAFIYVVYRYKEKSFRQAMYANPCLLWLCFRRQQ